MEVSKGSGTVHRLRHLVVEELKSLFAGRGELIELLALAATAGENLLVVGPPGTAKSEVVGAFASRLHGRYFEYLLTRFTEPSELFGAVDLAELRAGRVVTRTEGMLPEADLVFLDEVFHAGSAILNSLLGILNEGVFRRGSEVRRTAIISVFAASNALPDDPALHALEDRFALRLEVDYLEDERIDELLLSGWRLEQSRLLGGDPEPALDSAAAALGCDAIRALHRDVARVDLDPVRAPAAELVRSIRRAGLFLSDRRAVKLQRLAAASAVLCGREQARPSDLWPARYFWARPEERELLEELVAERVIETDDVASVHPLALGRNRPAELLARLSRLEAEIHRLAPESGLDRLDEIQDRLRGLAADRRWCRARDADEAAELERLGRRLEDAAASLDAKTS